MKTIKLASRGRPKGRPTNVALSSKNSGKPAKTGGPLGDLIRSNRIARGLGLLEVAKACRCSVQFVSNIEHGRAPLPWEKVESLAAILQIPASELQAANLSIRSDLRGLLGKGEKNRSAVASLASLANQDSQLRELILRYQGATTVQRKKFVRTAMELL